jgi:AcrR family transcriptional regulator
MSTIEPRQLRADARRNRERIVDAARDVFAQRGTEAQMDDIAARAGVGVGTVYRHFPTKQALVGEIIRLKFERHLETARGWAARASGWEALEGFLREVWGHMAEDSTQQRLMWIADEDALAQAERTRGELVAIVGGFIDAAHAEGTLRADFDVEDIPTIMCAVGSTMSADMAMLPRNVEGLLDVIVAGLRA